MREIKKEADGSLTTEQSEQFMLDIAGVTQKAFLHLGQMSPEQLLLAFRKPAESTEYTEAVNKIYQEVVEADMPTVFNDYIQSMAMTVCEKAFKEVSTKCGDNVALIVTKVTGIPYEDLTPKDAIAKLAELTEPTETITTE